jgi:predicted NAD-dependent protein-ADP-ribosyltransferase YbiA (DUF1768 family)
MGIFYSYCKKCNQRINWFLDLKDIICKKCNTLNTKHDINASFNNENYWKEKLIAVRKEKLNKLNKMDIGSGKEYPANALSNFAPHPFVFDGVEVSSAEGLLQSFKFKNFEIQKEVCKLVGRKAKFRGKSKKWYTDQKLYWNGVEYDRSSKEYQELLDRAFDALAENASFQKALLASGKATLTHEIGKSKENETVLTKREFISRLNKIRDRLFKEKNSFKFEE